MPLSLSGVVAISAYQASFRRKEVLNARSHLDVLQTFFGHSPFTFAFSFSFAHPSLHFLLSLFTPGQSIWAR